MYGYNTSVINSQNIYSNKNVSTIDEAYSLIKSDFTRQYWKCYSNTKLVSLENELMGKYDVPSITFCDISYDVSVKISYVIDKIYEYFPNIKGYLTNISIINSIDNSEFIAYFQPMYQFVNSYNDKSEFNNAGVNWYLGGVDPKYGNVVIECPAYKKYFVPANDNGCGMVMDPFVRHMKSSGFKNPVPFDLVVNVMVLVENVDDKRPQEIVEAIKQIREEDMLFRLEQLDNNKKFRNF